MQPRYQHYESMPYMTLHERCFPHRVMEGIWLWSVFSEEKDIYFNGYLIQTGAHEAILIDPPCAGPDVLDAFASLPAPTQIILTNADHERASAQFKDRFRLPVCIHEHDAVLLQTRPDRIFQDGEVFPGGWRAIHLPDQKTPGETALYHAETQCLILGDALIGKPLHQLCLLPAEKYADPQAAIAGLQRLTTLAVKTVLPGDGDPILQNAASLIQDALISH